MPSETGHKPAIRWRSIAISLLLLPVVAYSAWAVRNILYDRATTRRVIAYQAAYLQRMRDVEEHLNRYHTEFGEFPQSMEQLVASQPDAAKLLDPIPNAAAPYELRLELLSYPEKVLIAPEPGVLPGWGDPIWYMGTAVFNSPPNLTVAGDTHETMLRERALLSRN